MVTQIAADAATIRTEATRLAGKPGDLVQRACVYHHLYQHSAGNHAFPLLAAHGALWGAGHFRRGMTIGRILSLLDVANPTRRTARLAALAAFAEAFREINRRVCVETYTYYHLSDRHGEDPAVAAFMPQEIHAALNLCHSARRRGALLSDADKRRVFTAFFHWEQDNIVGPAVDAAIAALDWPVVKSMALRPPIGFQYLPAGKYLWFADFGAKPERIAKGEQAFDIAAQTGWDRVEHTLGRYGIMPAAFLASSDGYFDGIKQHVLQNNSPAAA